MVWPPRLPHSKDIFEYPAMFQFDQPGVPNALARTACTDTCVQMIIQYYKDTTISLNNIRRASGKGVDGVHGLNVSEALRALNYYGVTWYDYIPGVTATSVLQKAYTGPVLTGVGYVDYPARRGAACGQRNLAQVGGKTDCGFFDAHAILVIGNEAVKKGNKIDHYDVFTRDPDHHNSNGTQYDRFTGNQLTASMKSLVDDTPWMTTFALYPTKKK